MNYRLSRKGPSFRVKQESRRQFITECLGFIEKTEEIKNNISSSKVRRRVKINCDHIMPNAYLTQQEFRVVNLLMKGAKYKQIAEQSGLSVRTVEFYMANIKKKFGVAKKGELMKLFSSVSFEKLRSW